MGAACYARPSPGSRAAATQAYIAPHTGLLRATLSARGDWDVAVFVADSGRLVAASAATRSSRDA